MLSSCVLMLCLLQLCASLEDGPCFSREHCHCAALPAAPARQPALKPAALRPMPALCPAALLRPAPPRPSDGEAPRAQHPLRGCSHDRAQGGWPAQSVLIMPLPVFLHISINWSALWMLSMLS